MFTYTYRIPRIEEDCLLTRTVHGGRVPRGGGLAELGTPGQCGIHTTRTLPIDTAGVWRHHKKYLLGLREPNDLLIVLICLNSVNFDSNSSQSHN